MSIYAPPLYSNFLFDYVVSGCVWTADAAGSTKAASMTAGTVYIGGQFISVAAVTARTFTASKDVYVDVDSTGTPQYTDNTTNAASPALTAGSIRIAIVVVGASSIAAASSINQGQETSVLPIASSIPYAVTDSLGNLICSRDPNHTLLGLRKNPTSQGSVSTTNTLITGLSNSVIIPNNGRKVLIEVYVPFVSSTIAAHATLAIYNSATVTGSPIATGVTLIATAGTRTTAYLFWPYTPATGVQSYCAAFSVDAGTGSTTLSATQQASLIIRQI